AEIDVDLEPRTFGAVTRYRRRIIAAELEHWSGPAGRRRFHGIAERQSARGLRHGLGAQQRAGADDGDQSARNTLHMLHGGPPFKEARRGTRRPPLLLLIVVVPRFVMPSARAATRRSRRSR